VSEPVDPSHDYYPNEIHEGKGYDKQFGWALNPDLVQTAERDAAHANSKPHANASPTHEWIGHPAPKNARC
jgi:hypothetical protein